MSPAAVTQAREVSFTGTAVVMWFRNNFSMSKSGANFTFK